MIDVEICIASPLVPNATPDTSGTWFASAVFSDYFSAILGLVRQGSNWSLNPFGVRSSS